MFGIEVILLIPYITNLRLLGRGGKWNFYYLISSVVFAAGSVILARIFHNNLLFLTVMYFIQFVILSCFYKVIIKSPVVKRFIDILLIPVSIICLLDIFKFEGLDGYSSYFTSFRTLILIGYGIIYFWQLLRDEELVQNAVFIDSLPDFWFNAGLFVYHCGAFLYMLTYNFLLKGDDTLTASTTIGISFIAGIIQLILFYIGLLKAKKQHQHQRI